MTSFLKELANEMSVTAVAEVPGAAPAPAKMAVEHLNLFYGDFQGLRDVNLTFPENQVTALIGPSGCGKSTAMHCIAGLLHPAQGEIRFGDEVMTRAGEHGKDKTFVPPRSATSPWCFRNMPCIPT